MFFLASCLSNHIHVPLLTLPFSFPFSLFLAFSLSISVSRYIFISPYLSHLSIYLHLSSHTCVFSFIFMSPLFISFLSPFCFSSLFPSPSPCWIFSLSLYRPVLHYLIQHVSLIFLFLDHSMRVLLLYSLYSKTPFNCFSMNILK